MAYRNEAYFRKLEERKGLRYLLAGLAGVVALACSGTVGKMAYDKARPERLNLETKITAPENPQPKPVKTQSQEQEEDNYEMPRLNPRVVPIEEESEEQSKPVKRKELIVLDAGHGMSNRTGKVYDPGAVSGDYKEAEVVLSQAKKVKEYLEAKGYSVYLTREDSKTNTPLGKRNTNQNADVFVSLHYNASDSADANGTEVLYNGSKSQKLAEQIHYSLVNAINTNDRGIKERTNLRVLKSSIPSVIVETGFLSNEEDRNKTLGTYADEQAIADGIESYLAGGK